MPVNYHCMCLTCCLCEHGVRSACCHHLAMWSCSDFKNIKKFMTSADFPRCMTQKFLNLLRDSDPNAMEFNHDLAIISIRQHYLCHLYSVNSIVVSSAVAVE